MRKITEISQAEAFLRTPFEIRVANILELLTRFMKAFESQHELNLQEVYVLMYMYQVEHSSANLAREYLGLKKLSVNSLIFDLRQKGMIVSHRIKTKGNRNYMYITELGRVTIKNLIEIIKKQKV